MLKVRIKQTEDEAKLSLLRSRASNVEKKKKPEHLNLFADYDRRTDNKLVDMDKFADQKKLEDKYTVYLGETRNGKKEKTPWYALQSYQLLQGTKNGENESQKKAASDPLGIKNISIERATNLSIEDLRKQRLEREQKEAQRAAELLGSVKETQKYYSQYNPLLSNRRYKD